MQIILRAATLAGTGGTVNVANMPKPADLEDSYLLYLEALRDTCATDNRYGTGPHSRAELDTVRREAADALARWMRPPCERQLRP